MYYCRQDNHPVAIGLDYRVPQCSNSAYCLSLNYTLIDSDCARIVNTSELGKPIRLISLSALAKMNFGFMNVCDIEQQIFSVEQS